MVVYVLLSAFLIHSLDSSAISLLPISSPPQHGAELQPRIVAEEDLPVLDMTLRCLVPLTAFLLSTVEETPRI